MDRKTSSSNELVKTEREKIIQTNLRRKTVSVVGESFFYADIASTLHGAFVGLLLAVYKYIFKTLKSGSTNVRRYIYIYVCVYRERRRVTYIIFYYYIMDDRRVHAARAGSASSARVYRINIYMYICHTFTTAVYKYRGIYI